MSTTPNQLTTQDYERFIDHHRLVLLRYLDGTAPASAQELDALGYVESVLTAWQEAFGSADLEEPTAAERTFWFALYQLEELVETSGRHIDPYEGFLMKNLIEARKMLRQGRALPAHRFMASRPDGA